MKEPSGSRIRADLDRHYQRNGLHSLDFSCRHRSDCSAGCSNFTEAKASLVGDAYGDPFRVVVLSLDPGQGLPDPEERTANGVAERHRLTNPDLLPKNRHWFRTFETLAALFSEATGERWAPRDALGRFAHVNAAKCSCNLPNKKQAPKRLFNNCRAYLQAELSLLKPDVIVTQGKLAARVLSPWSDGEGNRQTVRIGGREAFWLELVHPTAWGGAYLQERKSWPERFREAKRWVDRESVDPTPECPFCAPEADRVFLEQDRCQALWDGFPVSQGHALITPIRHVARWSDLNPLEQTALTRAISRVQDEITRRHRPTGFNIGINDGAAAGQTVPHLHIHVIPRYEGDVADPRGGIRWVMPEKADYWSEREK